MVWNKNGFRYKMMFPAIKDFECIYMETLIIKKYFQRIERMSLLINEVVNF